MMEASVELSDLLLEELKGPLLRLVSGLQKIL
jgi:hypothetical protein